MAIPLGTLTAVTGVSEHNDLRVLLRTASRFTLTAGGNTTINGRWNLQANATLVDGDVDVDRDVVGVQFALPGLSDSANLIAYYDDEDVQVRLAYNWRDDFLAGAGQGQGTLSNPTYVKDYGQWDLNVTYYFNDNLTFYFSGLNLTNETRHVYGLSERQVLQAVQLGPRYDFGVRYNFDY